MEHLLKIQQELALEYKKQKQKRRLEKNRAEKAKVKQLKDNLAAGIR